MEWVESTGRTVDEAKDVALDRLGVHEDDAEFEIMTEEKLGVFGRVKEEARVRARVRPATPRAKDDRGRRRQRGGRGGSSSRDDSDRQKAADRGKPKRGQQRRRDSRDNDGDRGGQRNDRAAADQGVDARTKNAGGSGQKRTGSSRQRNEGKPVSEDQPTMPLDEQADLAEDFVAGLAERFGADVSFEQTEMDDDIHLTVSGSDLGRMIGRRGTTAMAIDELVRTVLQRQAGSSRDGRIRVDIGGVRARRTEALTSFCLDLAGKVRDSGVATSLEPMGGADRKIVHDVINDEVGVDTISEGEDPNRRVVIVPVGDAD